MTSETTWGRRGGGSGRAWPGRAEGKEARSAGGRGVGGGAASEGPAGYSRRGRMSLLFPPRRPGPLGLMPVLGRSPP